MANPMYGQNKADDGLDMAANANLGGLDVIVGGNDTAFTLAKEDCCKIYVNGNAGGMDIALPAVSAADAGLWIKIQTGVTVTSSDLISVTAASGDLLEGHVIISKASDAIANAAYFAADESNDLIFSMNGSTTGGLIGSWAKFTVNKNGYWTVEGELNGSGTLATPFS